MAKSTMELYNTQQTYNPLTQLAYLLLLAGVGIVIGTLATFGIALTTIHAPLSNLAQEILKPENIASSRWMQVVATFFYMAVPAYIFAKIISQNPIQQLGFKSQINIKQFGLVVLIIVSALFVSGALGELNNMIPLPENLESKFKAMEDQYNTQVIALTSMNSVKDFIISLLLIALLPAVFEEMFFRGALQQVFIKLFSYPLAGILVTAIFFSAIHLSFYGFIPRMFLGIMLGYLFYFSKNLWLNIIAHFLNNAIALTQMFLLSSQGKLTKESMNDTFPWYYGLLAGIAFIFFLIRLKKESNKNLQIN